MVAIALPAARSHSCKEGENEREREVKVTTNVRRYIQSKTKTKHAVEFATSPRFMIINTTTIKICHKITRKANLDGGVVAARDDLRVHAVGDDGADRVAVPAQHVHLVLRADVPHLQREKIGGQFVCGDTSGNELCERNKNQYTHKLHTEDTINNVNDVNNTMHNTQHKFSHITHPGDRVSASGDQDVQDRVQAQRICDTYI